jgi:hypothetical protein
MEAQELRNDLCRLTEWVINHLSAIEAEFPQDAKGFAILPKGADGDAVRALRHVEVTLTRIIYNHLGGGAE